MMDTPIGMDFCGPQITTNYCWWLLLQNITTTTNNKWMLTPQHEGGGSQSHGTKMAGVAGAKINNMRNVAGLAGGTTASDGVRIMGLRAGYDRTERYGWVYVAGPIYTQAINLVTAHQSRNPDLSYVVNMSFATGSTRIPPPHPVSQQNGSNRRDQCLEHR